MIQLLRRLPRLLLRLSASPWFHYAALVVLLIRLTWGMWEWRDLTYGDTSSYFASFNHHAQGGKPISLVFSPLYVLYYSWFGSAFSDAFAATLLHRIGVIFLAGFSVFLLFRSVLPKPVGWLVAAWWIVLPINWNALYEVHLFGVIPLALGCWAVAGARRRTLWLGVGLALVWMGALLVRNEFALSVALLTVCCVAREAWLARRKGQGLAGLAKAVLLLAAPGLVATLLAVLVFHSSWGSWSDVRSGFRARHELNIAQVYPFTYQQRHPEWTLSPWTDGEVLMKEHFGKPYLSFSEAYKRNPKAIWGHILWNFKLLPAGIQLGMFNNHVGAYSPDFTPPRQNDPLAGTLSVIALLAIGAGGWLAWRNRALYFRLCHKPAAWCWVALFCMLPPCVVAIVTQRPRPSYLFMLAILLMIVCGWSAVVILRSTRGWRHFRLAFPFLALAVIVAAVPEKSTAQIYTGQPLREMYHALRPYRALFKSKRTVYCSRNFTVELINYLASDQVKRPKARTPAGLPATSAEWGQYLDEHGVNVLSLDGEQMWHEPIREWIGQQQGGPWTVVTNYTGPGAKWMLLFRKPVQPTGGSSLRK